MSDPGHEAAPTGLTRRRFLRRTLAGVALLGVGGTVLRHITGYSLEAPWARSLRVLSDKEALVLAAIARRMLAADAAGAPTPDEIGVVPVIDDYLAGLAAPVCADVKALLQLVEHGPALFDLRPSRFTRLDAAAQDVVLAGWEASRLEVRRRGFAALRNLCALGYYGDPRTFAILGYRPTLPGAPGAAGGGG